MRPISQTVKFRIQMLTMFFLKIKHTVYNCKVFISKLNCGEMPYFISKAKKLTSFAEHGGLTQQRSLKCREEEDMGLEWSFKGTCCNKRAI